MHNTAGDSDWVVLIVIITVPACLNDGKSARHGRWSIFPLEITRARPATTAGARSAAIWISKPAGDAMRARHSELELKMF